VPNVTPELLSRAHSVLVVIDVQEKLLPHVHEHGRLLQRLGLLLSAARTLDIPVVLTEQYPKGLGPTVAAVRELTPGCDPLAKTDFSCVSAAGFLERLAALNRSQVVLAGIETHVCVGQTALELCGRGTWVTVVADATGSRRPVDMEVAIKRFEASGVGVTTTEAVVFEWLRRAGTEEFKTIQQKLKALE